MRQIYGAAACSDTFSIPFLLSTGIFSPPVPCVWQVTPVSNLADENCRAAA